MEGDCKEGKTKHLTTKQIKRIIEPHHAKKKYIYNRGITEKRYSKEICNVRATTKMIMGHEIVNRTIPTINPPQK